MLNISIGFPWNQMKIVYFSVKEYYFLWYDILTAVIMMITIFWNVTSCSVVEINGLLRETYNLFFHGTVEDGSKNVIEDGNVNRRPEDSFQLV
jgi:hypothetical protein